MTAMKENIGSDTDVKSQFGMQTPISQKHISRHSPLPHKMSDLKGNFEPPIIFDPQRKVSPQSSIKILSF